MFEYLFTGCSLGSVMAASSGDIFICWTCIDTMYSGHLVLYRLNVILYFQVQCVPVDLGLGVTWVSCVLHGRRGKWEHWRLICEKMRMASQDLLELSEASATTENTFGCATHQVPTAT